MISFIFLLMNTDFLYSSEISDRVKSDINLHEKDITDRSFTACNHPSEIKHNLYHSEDNHSAVFSTSIEHPVLKNQDEYHNSTVLHVPGQKHSFLKNKHIKKTLSGRYKDTSNQTGFFDYKTGIGDEREKIVTYPNTGHIQKNFISNTCSQGSIHFSHDHYSNQPATQQLYMITQNPYWNGHFSYDPSRNKYKFPKREFAPHFEVARNHADNKTSNHMEQPISEMSESSHTPKNMPEGKICRQQPQKSDKPNEKLRNSYLKYNTKASENRKKAIDKPVSQEKSKTLPDEENILKFNDNARTEKPQTPQEKINPSQDEKGFGKTNENKDTKCVSMDQQKIADEISQVSKDVFFTQDEVYFLSRILNFLYITHECDP